MANKFSELLGLAPKIMRLLLIEISIKLQQESQLFLYEHATDIYAFRLPPTHKVISYLKEKLISMLNNPSTQEIERLQEAIETGMQYYIAEFAGKKFERDKDLG